MIQGLDFEALEEENPDGTVYYIPNKVSIYPVHDVIHNGYITSWEHLNSLEDFITDKLILTVVPWFFTEYWWLVSHEDNTVHPLVFVPLKNAEGGLCGFLVEAIQLIPNQE